MGRLSAFVLGLPLDPAVAAQYGKDPQSAQKAAGLTAAERCLLSTGRTDLLAEALRLEIESDLGNRPAWGRAASFFSFLVSLETTGDYERAIERSHLSPSELLMLRSSDLTTLADAIGATLAICHYGGGTSIDEFVQLIARQRKFVRD